DLARSDLPDRGCDICGNEVPGDFCPRSAITGTTIESSRLQLIRLHILLRLTLVLTHILEFKANLSGVGASASKTSISFLCNGIDGCAVRMRQLASSFCLCGGQQRGNHFRF